MENEIIIRKVTNEDFNGLVKLYNEVWPDVTYNKIEKANFILHESDGVRYCAEKNGEIVGSRTSYWINFLYGGRQLRCVELADSCSRKDCRGQGLFGKMNKALLADFFSSETGGELIWNISVEASKRVYEKLGWNYIKSLSTLLKICRPFHILSCVGLNYKMILGPVEWDLSNDTIRIEDDLLNAREEVLVKTNLLHVCYNKETIAWRQKTYSGMKQYDDSNFGSVIYKIGNKNGLTVILVGEVFLKEYNKHNLEKLLHSFQKSLFPDLIKLAVSLGHPLLPLYRSCGFSYNPRNRFLFHGVRVETQEMKDICYKPENWAISMLDVDTF